MRYQMRQKFFALGDDFTVRDESGTDRFIIDGKVFSIGNKLAFLDTGGNELATVRQRLLAWGPTYEITGVDGLFAVVKKQLFSVFHCTFYIDVPGPDDLEATGDFLDHEYTFTRGGQVVATVSKAWFSLTDSYGVEIADGENDILILASTAVIDLCCHTEEKH